MALNIKNDEAHDLAKRLAETRGTSLTEAVTEALRRMVGEEERATEPNVLIGAIEGIQRFVADLPDRDCREPDDILGYDDRGLPR